MPDNDRIEDALRYGLIMFRNGHTVAQVQTYLDAEIIAAQEPQGRAA